MNELIKQFSTPDSSQLSCQSIKSDQSKGLLVWVPVQGVFQNIYLNFHKMNRRHYPLEAVAIIPLFHTVFRSVILGLNILDSSNFYI